MTASLSIQPLSVQQVNQPFAVSGTLSIATSFNYADNAGTMQPFPAGSVEPSAVETWAFIHPGYSVSGAYTLSVEETLTGAAGVITVNVNDPPSEVSPAVSGVTVTAQIVWLAVTGTPPITYTVLFRVHGTTTWETAGSTQATTYVVTGLSPGEYDFAVYASNAAGSTQGTNYTVATANT